MGQAAALDRAEGLILGRYRPLEPLGSGGSGTVWLARDEAEGRDVALKVVAREGNAGERAEREAQAVAKLRHRRCARVYAVERDDRHVYIAYEHVPGRTLRERLRDGSLDDASGVEAAAQVLDALAHTHQRGIVHRDVKPANVLVEEGETIAVRLLDFGLAQLDEGDSLTATGDVPGTLAYIAPERLAGRPATGAADVWAVGVILWEALAGYQPFGSASPVETARRIAAGAPPLGKVRPDLPRALAAAVDRALAREPARRPRPKQLAAALRASIEEARERRARRPAVSRGVLLERAPHAVLAAAFVALAASLLPFFPPVFTPLLALLAFLAALTDPRAGLVFALAVPVLPLGDVSLGLALLFVGFASAWAAAVWRDARHGLLCVAGPVLALAGLLPLVVLVAERAEGAARRALHAGAAVVLAGLVGGLRGAPLPFTGDGPPRSLGVEGSESPTAVAGVLWRALADHPAFAVEAVVLAAAATLVPVARRRGVWGAAAFAAGLLAVAALAPPMLGAGAVSSWGLVLGAWILAGALAAPALRPRLAT